MFSSLNAPFMKKTLSTFGKVYYKVACMHYTILPITALHAKVISSAHLCVYLITSFIICRILVAFLCASWAWSGVKWCAGTVGGLYWFGNRVSR